MSPAGWSICSECMFRKVGQPPRFRQASALAARARRCRQTPRDWQSLSLLYRGLFPAACNRLIVAKTTVSADASRQVA
jgi:hypothetical protein